MRRISTLIIGYTIVCLTTAASALHSLGLGNVFPNKQTVIFSKMTLLATSSSTTEKKISKQGFRMPKFRIPVDAVIFSLGM